MKKEEVIHLGSYNIQNGRNGGLESELCGMYQANIDLGILQENKVARSVYMWYLVGFCVE